MFSRHRTSRTPYWLDYHCLAFRQTDDRIAPKLDALVAAGADGAEVDEHNAVVFRPSNKTITPPDAPNRRRELLVVA